MSMQDVVAEMAKIGKPKWRRILKRRGWPADRLATMTAHELAVAVVSGKGA